MGDGFFIPGEWENALDPDGSIREALAREDPDPPEVSTFTVQGYVDSHGRTYVWMCPLCLQPLPPGARCNSGIHQGPEDGNEGVPGVRSCDLGEKIMRAKNLPGEHEMIVKRLAEAGQAYIRTLMTGGSRIALRIRSEEWHDAKDEALKEVKG